MAAVARTAPLLMEVTQLRQEAQQLSEAALPALLPWQKEAPEALQGNLALRVA